MIRTSGELRLSNYLLWQLDYTEFYFTDVLWPDFNKKELIRRSNTIMDETADLEEYKFMFKLRLISGIILVLIAAFGLYMGGIVTFAMTLIVA